MCLYICVCLYTYIHIHMHFHEISFAAEPVHVLVVQDGKGHHPEGRVIICEFPSGLTVLSTYAPNNGNKAESFKRRQDWDKSVNEWVTSKKEEGKKVIWMGGGSRVCV